MYSSQTQLPSATVCFGRDISMWVDAPGSHMGEERKAQKAEGKGG